MISAFAPRRLLAGPRLDGTPEDVASHVERLGVLPRPADPSDVVDALDASGLLGRGGAGFPVGRKWRALASRRGGRASVVVNGAEGEPASAKDRVLMAHRPHLVVDGAILAARATGADEIVFYVGSEHTAAVAAMRDAIAARRHDMGAAARIVAAPVGYVAGEASAAVHFIEAGDARPTTTPPRISERGLHGGPTLVQNVESLAYAALIARFGSDWYRTAGRGDTRGTALVTVNGAAGAGRVREIEIGATVREVLLGAGESTDDLGAVVVGGYFGTWARAHEILDLPLDPATMRDRGLTFGCGMIGALPRGRCGVEATAGIMGFMAHESAGQCGPCVFGLRAIADAVGRIGRGQAAERDLPDLRRWADLVAGRGACHHPDGAIQLLVSALVTFEDDFVAHAARRRCDADRGAGHAVIDARVG